MDYSTYDIDFTEEGRRRVHLFSYVLGYSRRQYLRFVETQDLPTTLREHVRAFEHLGGVAATCLYDNMKVVVLRHGDEGPLYNPKFLAFATHYGFTPQACRVRRSQTKGKVERPFYYVETNLLNGRTFRSLEHLNEVTAWWLANVADVRVHRETKQRPLDRHAEERPHLIPLPATPYDVAVGRLPRRQRRGLRRLPAELLLGPLALHRPGAAGAHHRDRSDRLRVPPSRRSPATASCRAARRDSVPSSKAHRPGADPRQHEALLRERFAELGPLAERFLDGLLRDQRYGKDQALKVLALLGTYARADLLAALERAVRFGAYSLSAVERILAAQAQPQSVLDVLAEQERRHLPTPLRDNPVSPRPTTDYQHLVEEPTDHGPPPATAARSRRPTPLPTPAPADLRERILADFAALKVPLTAEQFDAVLAAPSADGLSHQQFLHLLIAEQADRRRERSIAHRIREARFRERKPLSRVRLGVQRSAIDRTQIEELATRRLHPAPGQPGLGRASRRGKVVLDPGDRPKPRVSLGYSVRYTTSAALLNDLTASLADQTLPERVRYYARFDLLIIDEFGFDQIERSESPQAANLLYKIIDARTRQRSTALVTNIDFDGVGRLPGRSAAGDGLPGPGGRWGDHLEDQRQVVPGPSGQFAEASAQLQARSPAPRSTPVVDTSAAVANLPRRATAPVPRPGRCFGLLPGRC